MGNLKREKNTPLSRFFLKYFLYLGIGILVIGFCGLILFNIFVTENIIYPADYAQKQANESYDEIAQANNVNENIIPELCQYVIFDSEGVVKNGNIEKKNIKNAWSAIQGDASYEMGNFYKVIYRKNEYCVLKFNLEPQYKSALLRKYLLPPQTLLMVITGLMIAVYSIFIAMCFGQALTKKLVPLMVATKKIQSQKLDFAISLSGIKEIDTVLISMDQMRVALRNSLENQWELEQTRKEQISALAHDLKTPITIIRGNTDLINETMLTNEQKECMEYIQNSVLQMQDYVKSLIEILRTEDNIPIEMEEVNIQSFLSDLKIKSQGLVVSKNIELVWTIEEIPCKININQPLFARAVLNIFSNAVDFTPQNGKVEFNVAKRENMLEFKISDTGEGFTSKDLSKATEQFYMGDESRTLNLHYGMGLYITNTIIEKHNGKLLLENSMVLNGAEVTIMIPC